MDGTERARGRRSFTPQFKAETVDICRRGDRSIAQVARDYGLSESTVRAWVKQADIDAGLRFDGPTTAAKKQRAASRRKQRRRRRLLVMGIAPVDYRPEHLPVDKARNIDWQLGEQWVFLRYEADTDGR